MLAVERYLHQHLGFYFTLHIQIFVSLIGIIGISLGGGERILKSQGHLLQFVYIT